MVNKELPTLTGKQKKKLWLELGIDEVVRDRTKYVYSSDVIKRACVAPYSIWAEPNDTVASVIAGDVKYDSVPYDGLNEGQKGILFTEQAELIVANEGRKMLCEALGASACLKEACPLYIPEPDGHPVPLCREFKITFAI